MASFAPSSLVYLPFHLLRSSLQFLLAALPMSNGTRNHERVPSGLLPPTLHWENQLRRSLAQLRTKEKPLEGHIFLSQLKHANEDMFYRLLLDNLLEIVPLIYTPTVGEACQQYSQIYRQPEGLYVSISEKGNIRAVLQNWPRLHEARIAVVTDGSRILGLGDQGVNGMPISIGKLSLYVGGAGIRPSSTVPICLDLGTNNKANLVDPLYLGVQHPRVGDQEMEEFMEEFMREMTSVFPHLLIQFEDFSTENAFKYLALFRDRYPVFNDDIQGTGGVVLSGFINAAKLSSAASGLPLKEHRVVFFGAGSAGVGVARQLLHFFKLQGLTEEEAKKQIWTVDSKGLITADRTDLQEHKKFFARHDYQGAPLKSLIDIINYVKPTALLGLSTVHGSFTKDVVEALSALNTRPIIFPLSNPVSLSECSFAEAIEWSNGTAIFASGSPFPKFEYKGVVHEPGQGNNMYIFPGLGLGSLLAQATRVTSSMVEAASIALADSLTDEERAADLIYPRLARIRDISAEIAISVIKTAISEGVDRSPKLRKMDDASLLAHVKSKMWTPPATDYSLIPPSRSHSPH
ncbi:hypothetical protein BOTBODRAFT_30567 [Botryobasidium botryosum FD-172 SS1]|uniref:Malic enzyme n=1 Tax=Botryobasidium botryosum (strain FD-172 SS1) TaxID=930990 RepID=A0A067MLL9_BOTB1|nr:hypothetical protein BOTBODRAFT_30567 [Botryobasidium botryosum FD-172 SS1]